MFKRLQAWANRKEMAPEPYSFLPAIEPWPSDAADPPVKGWWLDPLSSDDVTQRYFDGTRWTPYVSVRSAQRWTQIIEDRANDEVDPEAQGIPQPPASPDAPPEPPTGGLVAGSDRADAEASPLFRRDAMDGPGGADKVRRTTSRHPA